MRAWVRCKDKVIQRTWINPRNAEWKPNIVAYIDDGMLFLGHGYREDKDEELECVIEQHLGWR